MRNKIIYIVKSKQDIENKNAVVIKDEIIELKYSYVMTSDIKISLCKNYFSIEAEMKKIMIMMNL